MRKLIFALAFWLLAVSAEASTWYVRPGGSDSHTCTQAQTDTDANAKKTINGGLSCVGTAPGQGAGHIVDVHGGTYNEAVDSVDREFPKGSSWAPGQFFTLQGHPGETVTWRHTGELNLRIFSTDNHYSVVQGFVFDGANVTSNAGQVYLGAADFGGNYIRFQDNELINNKIAGGSGSLTHNIEVLRNKIHGGSWSAPSGTGPVDGYPWYHSGNDSIFEGNEVWDFIAYGFHFFNDGARPGPDRNIIRRNKFHDFGGHCGSAIIVSNSPTQVAHDNQIYDNVIYNSVAGNCGVGAGGIIGFAVGSLIYNNTIYNVGDPGIEVNGNNTQVKNNIISQINFGGDIFRGTPNASLDSNNLCPSALTGCSVVSNNPSAIFVNPGSGDLQLKDGSPAIGQALDLGAPYNIDYAGNVRTAPWDIGAFKYTAVAPTLVVTIKTDMTVLVSRRSTDTSTVIALVINKDTVIGPGGFEITYPPGYTLTVSRRGGSKSTIASILVNKSMSVIVNGAPR